MQTGNTETWLRKREVAQFMGVKEHTVDRYRRQGLLTGHKLFFRIVIFKKSEVEALMETLRTQGERHLEKQENGYASK